MQSPQFSLNRDDAISILKGLMVALVGAALTYFSQVVAQADFGQYTPIVVAIFSVIANVIRKWLEGSK